MLFQRCLFWSWQGNRRIHPVPVIKNLHFKEWQYCSTSWIGDIHSWLPFPTLYNIQNHAQHFHISTKELPGGTPGHCIRQVTNTRSWGCAHQPKSAAHAAGKLQVIIFTWIWSEIATIWLCPRWTNFAHKNINSRKIRKVLVPWELQLVAAPGTATTQKSEATSLPLPLHFLTDCFWS